MTDPSSWFSGFSSLQIDWTTLGKEVGLGAIFGFAIGFAAKMTMKLVLIVIGVLLLLAVLLEQKGIITVQWDVLEATYGQSINSKAITEALTQFAQRLGRLIPLSGGFVAGFLLGFRVG
ncbi:MAG: FUN14 domain-containing protein [Limnochordia bacterium]